jgi:hypothetical protein
MRLVTIVLVVGLVAGPISLWPAQAEAQTHSAAGEFGYGVLAVACDIVYAPVKIIYALGGTLIAGPAWLVSGQDRRVFRAIIQPAVRGDYLVTPEHLRGEQALHFMGRDPELGPYGR